MYLHKRSISFLWPLTITWNEIPRCKTFVIFSHNIQVPGEYYNLMKLNWASFFILHLYSSSIFKAHPQIYEAVTSLWFKGLLRVTRRWQSKVGYCSKTICLHVKEEKCVEAHLSLTMDGLIKSSEFKPCKLQNLFFTLQRYYIYSE